jgi:hypothetical protein
MSAQTAYDLPLTASGPAASALPAQPGRKKAPYIEAVPKDARRARPKTAYALVTVGGVLVVVIAQLLLGVGLSQGAYEISSLQASERSLGLQLQTVSNDVKEISSPQYLAANAESLGMVINGTPAYLRLSDGSVTGNATAATTDTPVPLISSNAIPNSLIAGDPLAVAPDATVGDPDAPAEGAPTDEAAPPTVSLENGLPSPSTH